MVLTLYDRYGNMKAELPPEDGSTQDKEIQGDNILSLSFTLYEHVPIDVGDYVDFLGERYRAVERYNPAEKSSVEWEYDVRLYGMESLLNRFLVTNGGEAVFSLTARPAEHLRLIVKCINDGMDHTTDWKAGQVEGTILNIPSSALTLFAPAVATKERFIRLWAMSAFSSPSVT